MTASWALLMSLLIISLVDSFDLLFCHYAYSFIQCLASHKIVVAYKKHLVSVTQLIAL